ncbi:hypothetical protein JOF56_002288 [Kibdelosporangium banguiense]|uniref:Uncharacterized protein n=1 Tax=Kibdelosporangium banguiense TaxID=1365924 RepID=A0ABS4TBU3_9PSEU|nr:hypothetical protein [Kibdelosporangium banguiense]MBP2321903.1 hypothetical protein [Kibdelosporangium banguiense]
MTDELERKLRSALTEMADEVRPSHHPWAEHQRRISARRSRRPLLMAAVAAAVVALIAVPVMILQMRSDPVQAADIPEPSAPPTQTTTYSSGRQPDGSFEPQAGEKVLTPPVVLTSEGSSGDYVRTLAYTTERDGLRFLCLTVVRGQDTPVIKGTAGSDCSQLSPPRAGKYVWGSRLVTSTSSNAQMLYVASPPTDSVLVRLADGSYAGSLRLSQADDGFSVFTVYLSSNKPPAAFTARDKAKATLENG